MSIVNTAGWGPCGSLWQPAVPKRRPGHGLVVAMGESATFCQSVELPVDLRLLVCGTTRITASKPQIPLRNEGESSVGRDGMTDEQCPSCRPERSASSACVPRAFFLYRDQHHAQTNRRWAVRPNQPAVVEGAVKSGS